MIAHFEERNFFIFYHRFILKTLLTFFICNCFRFLDDIFLKELIQVNIQSFYKIMNELDPDLQFVFE